jgi:HKD family nuclease
MPVMFQEDDQFLESRELFSKIKELLNRATYVKIAVVFLTKGGYDELSANIEHFLKYKPTNKIDFIVGLSSYCITEPDALDALMKLQTSFSRQVKVKYYFNEGFHPKLFIFEHEEVTTVLVGSSNLTWQGLNINVEANVMLTRPVKSDFIISVQNYFKNLLDYAASDLETAFRQYDKMFKQTPCSFPKVPQKPPDPPYAKL